MASASTTDLVLVTAVPALVTYGFGLGYGPLYYVLAVIAVLGTPLLPAGIGALLVLLVARFAPARRVREVLGLVGALFGISCSLIGQTSRVWTAPTWALSTATRTRWLDRLRQIANACPCHRSSPGAGWRRPARDTGSARAASWPASCCSPSACSLCCVLAGRPSLRRPAGCGCRAAARPAQPARASRATLRSVGLAGRAPAWAAIALKDWRVIPRDLRNFAQLLSPLVILPVIYFNLLGGRGGAGRDLWQELPNGLVARECRPDRHRDRGRHA